MCEHVQHWKELMCKSHNKLCLQMELWKETNNCQNQKSQGSKWSKVHNTSV